jgi:hypothetical protein
MVTRIKLGNKIMAELPDEPGMYPTEDGVLGLAFGSVVNGAGDLSPAVILDCTDVKPLQSRSNRRLRKVNITREGRGRQLVANRVVLSVETDADLKQYWGGKER